MKVSILGPEYLEQQLLINGKAGTPSPGLAGIFTGSFMILYTNNITVTPQTLLAALTVPTYSGYAPILAAFGVPNRRNEGGIALDRRREAR